jgi:Protein of unknown function (DUF1397)
LDALKAKLPDSLANLNITNHVEKFQKMVREKCLKTSGSDAAYEQLEKAPMALKECFEGLLNVTQLQEEIKAAKPTGDLDTVFNK